MSTTKNTSDFHAFRAMHESGLLCLANAWDVGSALLMESLGARAVATTSAGMAWAAGYADGNRTPKDRVLAVAEGIARVIKVPVSVDIEGGYSSDPGEVGELAVQLATVGVAGVNLEDGAEQPDLLARKIEAVKTALLKAGLNLFVNARTDVFLAGLVEPDARVNEVLSRAKMYETAGADGLFVPVILALGDIRQVVQGSKLPLNVLAWNGLPPREQLEDAGVRRLSAGSGISTRVWAQAESVARRFLDDGVLTGEPKPYGDMQNLLTRA